MDITEKQLRKAIRDSKGNKEDYSIASEYITEKLGIGFACQFPVNVGDGYTKISYGWEIRCTKFYSYILDLNLNVHRVHKSKVYACKPEENLYLV